MLNPSVVSQSKQSYVNQLYHSWKRVDGWLKTQEIIKNEGSQNKNGKFRNRNSHQEITLDGIPLERTIRRSFRKWNMEVPQETEIMCLGTWTGRRNIFKDKGTHAIPARPVSKGRKRLQPKRTRTQEWVKKMGSIHTMACESASRKNDTVLDSGTGKR